MLEWYELFSKTMYARPELKNGDTCELGWRGRKKSLKLSDVTCGPIAAWSKVKWALYRET